MPNRDNAIAPKANNPGAWSPGVRYWADTPDGVGPKNWGYRIQVSLPFPKAK